MVLRSHWWWQQVAIATPITLLSFYFSTIEVIERSVAPPHKCFAIQIIWEVFWMLFSFFCYYTNFSRLKSAISIFSLKVRKSSLKFLSSLNLLVSRSTMMNLKLVQDLSSLSATYELRPALPAPYSIKRVSIWLDSVCIRLFNFIQSTILFY